MRIAGVFLLGTIACTGCSSLMQAKGPPQDCTGASVCRVPVELTAFDPSRLFSPCDILMAETVKVKGGTDVQWDLKTSVAGIQILAFDAPASVSGMPSGIAIDQGSGPKDFVDARFGDTTSQFLWTAVRGVKSQHQYAVHLNVGPTGSPIKCQLDPVIINEG